MRFLLKVNIPVESGNAAAKAGKLGATIQSILADLKPEAAYFTDDNGERTAFLILDMQEPHRCLRLLSHGSSRSMQVLSAIPSCCRMILPRLATPSRRRSRSTPERSIVIPSVTHTANGDPHRMPPWEWRGMWKGYR